jgi:hypothetical protein
MLLKQLTSYYHYFWLLLGAIIVGKILLSFFFNKHLEGVSGIIYAIFKWYGEEDQELAESGKLRLLMRLYNMITLSMYFVLGIIILSSVLPMFLTGD